VTSTARVVAIDGPAGSGKSTVARAVARALGLLVLDTGAMYRAVTLAVLERGIDPGDAAAAAAAAREAQIVLGEDGADTVLLDGRNVSGEIRGPAVTAAVSAVSAHAGVREVMVDRQRGWVDRHHGGVVEGRDIGTVVFPDAPVKVFLTASDEERVRRRQLDETAAARPTDVDAIRDALARRDALDSGRVTSPLRPADGALELDTTGRTVEDVTAEIVARFEAAGADREAG
jgi:cytidylate kinase